MYDWHLIDRAHEHCRDLLREAEQERLAKLALQGRPSRNGLRRRALLGLGRGLTALGTRLQQEDGGTANRPVLGSARSRPA
jgi:hypothetical protein